MQAQKANAQQKNQPNANQDNPQASDIPPKKQLTEEEKEELEEQRASLDSKIQGELANAQNLYDSFTKNDQSLKRKDTIEVVLDILKKLQTAAEEINKSDEQTREKLYYLTFNATVTIFKICHKLREAGFSKEATTYLAFNILCLDNNLILTTGKYLDWRVLNYVELSRAYADLTAYKASTRVISYGIQKVLYLKQIEEQDPPVPDGIKEILVESLRALRTQELKYQLQSGVLTADAWKKKIEETFSQNKYHRSLALVECLTNNDPSCNRLIQRNAKNLSIKTTCVKLSIDFIKADIELVKQALIQIHEKKKRDREKKDFLLNKDADTNIDELLEKYKSLDQEMIKEKDLKFASYNVPIEVHVEILKLCYECKLWAEFDLLLDSALVRLKFRRYEVPYLATVDILMSSNKFANIPNGFEKITKDLNQANLRIELKKLRAQAKKDGGGESAAPNKTQQAKKEEENKKKAAEEVKKPAAGKVDAKPKPGQKVDPKQQQLNQQQEIPKDEEDENPMGASDWELEKIKHVYVNLLLQRTKNSQNAIVGIDVVLADENVGPDIPDHHFAVAVPIRQHTGVYEKTKLIPYIVFRRTSNSLIDEEDCLSLVTDVVILQGQDAHLRAPLGYTRIDIDLRQTPKDLERVPNLDYVYLCYKTDKQLVQTERDLLIFRRLADLEKSLISTEKNSVEYKNLDEGRQFLSLIYNVDMLVDLSRTIKESLLGPLGDYYLEQRMDILFDISCLLWSKYLLPVMQRIDTYVELRLQNEYSKEFVEMMDESVLRTKSQFVEAFLTMHKILTRLPFVEDITMYCKFTIYLANLLEDYGDFRNAVQVIRSSLGKVVEYREERLKQCLDAKENSQASMSIMVDNKRIGELEMKMQTVYDTWEGLILRKERERERREELESNKEIQGVHILDGDEGDEEQNEVAQCIEELKSKDLFEKNINIEEWRKTMREKYHNLAGKKYYNEQEMNIHALHADLLVNLYRCEVKLGKEISVIKNQTNKLLISQGIDLQKHAPGNLSKNLSTTLKQKMNQTKGKTLAKSKNDLQNLKQTLQEAGKLPPPKPSAQQFEKILEQENNQNPYQMALLNICLAVAKSNIVEQKSHLLSAQEWLNKAQQNEDQMANLALENSIFIKASSLFYNYFGKSPDQVHPYSLMSRLQYIKKSSVPSRPIMISRTSTSITLKLPFYRPITEYKSWRNIGQMALFGKPAGSGVAVSLNNTEYDGTGEKRSPGEVITVTGLIPNEKYVFACGGYTNDGICVNGIGETSNEIVTVLPLSLHQLYGYFAEIAFKLGHFAIAKQAAEQLCAQFIDKNEFRYSFLDTRINPILAFKLNTEYIRLISPIEAKQIAEAFIILARVSYIVKSEIQKKAEISELKVEKQKLDMKICNYLVLALEISVVINQPVMIKRCIAEIYNHLTEYMKMQLRPMLLIQVLVKCQQSCRLIPQELTDNNLRKTISSISYQIMKLSFENNEEDSLIKRIMVSELPINTRKWRKYQQYVVRRPQLTEEQKLKKEEQEKRIQLGEKFEDKDLIREPEPYEEKVIKVEEFESEGSAFEEFLLSLIDYQDIVKAKNERWKLQINKFQRQATNGDTVVDKLKEGLVQVIEFWEGVKVSNPQVYLQQIITQFDTGVNQSARYLEFCCKCIRRSMELGIQQFPELEDILNNKVKISDDTMAQIETKMAERIEYFSKDVVRKQRKRFNILEEKVKQAQEKTSGTAKAALADTKKLQELMAGAASDEVDDYWQVVQYDSEEDEKKGNYQNLWISERFFLQGICQFLQLSQAIPQRSQLLLSGAQNCVFNDILVLDFQKFKQSLDEHNDKIKLLESQFEEENKKNNDKFVLKIEDRVQKVGNFLKTMSRAAEYAKNSRSWIQLENIIRYTWNVFQYDLTTPLELKETESWKYVMVLAECSLYLLEYLKNGGKLRKIVGQDIDQIRNHKQQLIIKDNQKTVAFKIDSEEDYQQKQQINDQSNTTQKSGIIGVNGKGLKWFEKIDDFDVTIHTSFIGFGIQCLMGVRKWESLVDISNRTNTATENTYAQNLLPFIIYAQTTLYEDAAQNTKEKRNELNVRVQQFENWKVTNKKKRSRQAMLTGEIPPEEQEFLKDKAQFEKEIFRLEIIENVLLTDKMSSENLLETIKRDANNCEESLKQSRRLYFQFGSETQNFKQEELKKGSNHYEIKAKRKGHKVFTGMVINHYKKTIELLRKRQEKFMLIQSLHELGNLLYADGQLGEAEIQWNDCIDTIFQKLYVINSFRSVFKENPQLADSFGSKQCLIGGIVLTKLSKLCYEGRDQYRYNECLLMAAELFAAPAKLSFPHPQVPIEYSNYKFREFLGENLFADKQIFTPSELLNTLGVASQALIDSDLFEKSLPLLSLMEYLAQDITKSKLLTIKARVLKAIALVEIGYINEAYQIYQRILNLKELPKIGSRDSEFMNKKDGKNFNFPLNQKYYNHLQPENEKNSEAIANILKVLTQEQITSLKKICSPYVLECITYLRALFLIRLGESENVEMPEKAEFRVSLLKAGEESLRQSLKNLSLCEEVFYLKDKLEVLQMKEVDIQEQDVSDTKVRLQKSFETVNILDEEQKTYYSNKEEEMCYADRRSQLLSLMLRERQQIARAYTKQGFLLQAFYILRQGLKNFKQYAEGQHKRIETGLESEDKGSFKLPDLYGGSGNIAQPVNAQQAKQQQEQAKKQTQAQDKKAVGGKGANQQLQQQQEEELQKKQEEERKKREIEEEQKERERVENAEKRDHPHIYLWLKLKLEIIAILFNQKRFEDCSDTIAITKLECKSVNDLYFIRQIQEIQFQIQVYSGQIESAIKLGQDIRKHAQTYNQNDTQYANFLGNLSELMYNKDKRTESSEVIKEGRMIIWYKLRDYGLDLDPQNINFKNDVKVNKQRTKPNEDVLSQFQTQIIQPGAKGGAQAQAKGGAAQKGQVQGKAGAQNQQVIEDLPTEEEKIEQALDFSKKVEYQLELADQVINSSLQDQNIYLRNLETAIRFDVRYSQYLTFIEKKHDLAKKVLSDAEKLLRRAVHISPQLKFYVYYLQGHSNMQIFYEKVKEFQDQFSSNPKYIKNKFVSHIPYNSIALGKFMLELPSFSDKMKKYFKDYLEWAKKAFKQAIDFAKQECILYEFDLGLVDALKAMSEVNFLLAEYRVRTLSYKYAKYKELDLQRKLARKVEQKKEQSQAIDDNLLEEELVRELQQAKDEWEEQKINKEKLDIANCKKQAIHYLETTINMSKAQRELVDKAHLLGTVNLTDPSKIPREVASEIFETFQVAKVNYVKIPDFDPKDKTAITSSELVAYLKALVKEMEFMTFGPEKMRLSKLISKLHRYLKINLASYVQKCLPDIKDPEEIKDANTVDNLEFIQKSKVLGKWTDLNTQKSSLFYIIGAIDEILLQQLYPKEQEDQLSYEDLQLREQIKKDHQQVHIGKVEVDPLVLSALYQEVRDLIDKMKISEKASASANERDKKLYKVKFYQLIERFGIFFKPQIVNEEDQSKDIDVMEQVKDTLPELTVENVEKLAMMLAKEQGFSVVDSRFNTILRKFHRIRYII